MHVIERMNQLFERTLEKMIWRMMLGAFVLAIAHQYLFYGQSMGLSYPLFVMLFYTYFYLFTRDRFERIRPMNVLLFAAVLLLSFTYMWSENPILYRLNAIAIPILMLFHTVIFASNRTGSWYDRRMVLLMLDHLIPQSWRYMPVPMRMIGTKLGKNMEAETRRNISRILLGVAIALPLILIVSALLMSADQMFNELLSAIPELLADFPVWEWILRLIWIFIACLWLFGYLCGLLLPEEREGEKSDSAKPAVKQESSNGLIMLTVLIAVNLVYVLFTAVQFTYLFGAWELELPSGMTYAEYARSGFQELVMVAVINFILLILSLAIFRHASRRTIRVSQIALSLLVGCTVIMLVSAFIRLQLYEQVYGYTYIRFLVHGFMIYMAALLGVAGVRIWKPAFSLSRYYIVISLIALIGINYIGIDRRIADLNIARNASLESLDTNYLNQLSADAVPRLVKYAKQEPAYRDSLQQRYERMQEEERSRDWRSYNWSRDRALRLLGDYLKEHE